MKRLKRGRKWFVVYKLLDFKFTLKIISHSETVDKSKNGKIVSFSLSTSLALRNVQRRHGKYVNPSFSAIHVTSQILYQATFAFNGQSPN